MTPFDLTLAALVLVGALWGMLRGALRQVDGVLAWIGTFVVPWRFAGVVAHEVEEPLGAPFPVAYGVAVLALALITHISVRLTFMALRAAWLKRSKATTEKDRPIDPNEFRRALDQSAGTLLGAATMTGLLWFCASLVAVADEPLGRRGIDLKVRDSQAMVLCARYNAIAILFGAEIHRVDVTLQRLIATGQAGHRRRPALDAVASDSRWQSIARDDTLSRALLSGDPRVLKQSPVLSLLTDRRALDRAAAAAAEKDEELPAPRPQRVAR